jgi:hypothetical protein
MELPMSEDQLKELIKVALVEVLEERRDLLHDAVEEALDDTGLIRAIREGARGEIIGREEVFNIVEGKV